MCQVLKHFFLIKMQQVQDLTSSEADKYGGMTDTFIGCSYHSFMGSSFIASWSQIRKQRSTWG